MNEVLCFINRFKQSNPSAMEEAFTRGNCYWFAFILKKRFPDGELVYDPVDGHFACRIGDHIYDITGEVDPVGFMPWVLYCKREYSDARRIRKQCIRLEVLP